MSDPVYTSQNKKDLFKKKDVAMILLGLFVEDIQMYAIRHPNVNFHQLLSQLLTLPFEKTKSMSAYLKGRSLWCISTCSEVLLVPNEETK